MGRGRGRGRGHYYYYYYSRPCISGRTALALALDVVEQRHVVGIDGAVLDGLLDRKPHLVEPVESYLAVEAHSLLLVLVHAVVEALTCDLG